MRLLLVQHGDAVPKARDPERPLSDEGRQDLGRLAWHLAMRELSVDGISHSGKTRARESAEILASAVGYQAPLSVRDDINPTDSIDPVLEELPDLSGSHMLVGHLPFMARLTDRLLSGRDDLGIANFKPGSLLCLERDEEGSWGLAWMVRPDII